MTDPVPEPSGEWQRLHPLSPLLRGGVVLLAILGYAASQLFDTFLNSLGFGDVFVGTDGSPVDDRGGGDPFEQAVDHPFIALAGLVLFLAVIAGVNWVSWRYSRFRVGGGQVELRQGVLFRQHRQVRLERVQAVELSRPLLARALGLARVVVQSAGGSDSTLTLSFLDLGRAEALREHLLELAGRTDEVAVMYAGRVVERAPTPELFKKMHMPYTEALLAAIPKIDAKPHTPLPAISGRPPDPTRPLRGCSFMPRCRYAWAQCQIEKPRLEPAESPDHEYACFRPINTAAGVPA